MLELGVVLLQIHLGQKIESFLGLQEDLKLGHDLSHSEFNALFFKANQAFVEGKHRIESSAAREAIEVCLCHASLLNPTTRIQSVRDTLLAMVVRPLEDELQRCFENRSLESLDEEAEKCMIMLQGPAEAHIPNGKRGTEMGITPAINMARSAECLPRAMTLSDVGGADEHAR